MKTLKDKNIRSPKRAPSKSGKAELFPYYAGFSIEFATDILKGCSSGSLVLDLWNGSGTTTHAASTLGLPSIGIDLNPVMVVVGKARSISALDTERALRKLESLLEKHEDEKSIATEPLLDWLDHELAGPMRKIVSWALSSNTASYINDLTAIGGKLKSLSSVNAFILLTLFISIKKISLSGKTSNPTWIKTRKPVHQSASKEQRQWKELILQEGHRLKLICQANHNSAADSSRVSIEWASAEKLPIESSSIDAILTSPPYCTRIDYARATLIELSVLGLNTENSDLTVRRQLMGTTTVNSLITSQQHELPNIVNDLLDSIKSHPSHGSKSYYYKNFKQYFLSLQNSVREMSRVLKQGGAATVVLQGSHYKEITIDLPKLFTEIASSENLHLEAQLSFENKKTFASINTKSRKYKDLIMPNEKVLFFGK